MTGFHDLHPQYITDEKGEKHAVILPLAEFEGLLEDIEDLARVAERREESTIAQEDIVRALAGGRMCPPSRGLF